MAIAAHAALRRPDAGSAIQIRIANHAGAADRRDGDYFGPALNRLARILAATNGGQTLVTAAAADGIASGEIAAHPLGAHRLRSIPEPVALVEITAVGEEPSDRPVRSLDRGQLAHLAGAHRPRAVASPTSCATLPPG